jgi:excisionase family DNA binding protein
MRSGRPDSSLQPATTGAPVHALLELDLAQLAAQLAPLVAARIDANASPWLTAAEAAAYLRCPISRVRRLTMTGDLPTHRDGRRVLYRRDELDAFVASGGAISP